MVSWDYLRLHEAAGHNVRCLSWSDVKRDVVCRPRLWSRIDCLVIAVVWFGQAKPSSFILAQWT